MNGKTLLHFLLLRKAFYTGILLLPILFFTSISEVIAQTPGLIYKPALNGGELVLDPNRDLYSSANSSGFVSNDESESEIPFRKFPLLTTEPLGDLNTGAAGGHTDLAPVPLYSYFDGRNLMFRFRLAGQSTASKGYSVLIDTDNTLKNAGLNPGFEFEVLLASNFSVQILDHRTAPSQVIFNGNVDQYHQRSIALSRGGNDPDYFYDFYVPISAFGSGLTANTPLRMTGFTVTSAQSGLTGTVSDVGGVNFASYNYTPGRAWQDVISTFPPTSPSQIQAGPFPQVRSFCPFINSPLVAGATTVTGTTTEAAGTIIRVYSGSSTTPIGTTTTTAANWSVSVPALAPNAIITATAQATNESESVRDCNPVTVTGDCARPAAPTITGLTSNQNGFVGTSTLPLKTPINIYQVTEGGASSKLYLSGTVTSSTAPNFVITISGTGQTKVPVGEYFARSVVDGCESNRSAYFCPYGTAASGSVSITAPVVAGTPSVSGTLTRTTTGNATIVLFVDGLQLATTVIASGVSPWTIMLPQGTSLRRGQVLTARAFEVDRCSSVSAAVTVVRAAAAPSISGNYCGTIRSVSGTSTEPAGTSIVVFATPAGSTIAEQVGTATVTTFGTWTSTLTRDVTAGNVLTARASNPSLGLTQSPASNAVTVEPITSNANLSVNGPILEGDNVIMGTYPTVGAQIRLYIEGSLLATAEPIRVLDNGTWGVTGISPFETFAGARITATAQTDTNCESLPSAAVVVQCSPPLQREVRPTAGATCTGSPAAIQVLKSERGIVYQLESAAEGSTSFVPSGTSVLGNGSDITLTSGIVNQRTIFRVIATRIAGTACSTILTQTATINATPLPAQETSVVSGPASVCANTRANISITNTNPRFSYQLRIGTDTVGTAVPGPAAGGTLPLPTNRITAATTYNVFVTDTQTGCSSQFSPAITITPSGASATGAVTVANSAVCIDGSSSISVATENNSNYRYQIYQEVDGGARTAVGDPFTGTGAIIQRPLGPFSTAGIRKYTVEISNTAAGVACPTIVMASQPTITVSNSPTVADAGQAQSLCDVTTATLKGNTPVNGTGKWSIIESVPTDGASAVTITNPLNPSTTVSGLQQGYTYVFRWTISASCGGTTLESTNRTQVTINCPSTYQVAPARFVDQYTTGDVLAIPSDIDGGISAAQLVSGSNIPAGVKLESDPNSPQLGYVIVSNQFSLVPGTYSFQVELTDIRGNRTLLTVTITFHPVTPDPQPLPVDLVAFTATVAGETIRLDWQTASEQNNDHFQVQRSSDGHNFTTIGTVAGNGNSNRTIDYSLVDRNPLSGINYYRLVQVDFDGTETFSPVISATFSGVNQQLKIYPNPTQGIVQIVRPSIAAENIRLSVQDTRGITVMDQIHSAQAGENSIRLDISSLPAGVYYLSVESVAIERSTVRLVKIE